MINVSKNTSFKKSNKRDSFLRNIDNFLVVFIVFTWGIIFESAMGKWEVKCKVQLRPKQYFSVNVSVVQSFS